MHTGNNVVKSSPKLISVLFGGLFLAATVFCGVASAASAENFVRQDLTLIKNKIEDFLVTQTTGYPGKVTVTANAVDPNLKLAECAALEVFLPPGSRAWGRTSVGVRCNAPTIWTIYAQAKVSVKAQYLAAATALAQGHVMTSQDIVMQEGDLAQLPTGVFTDAGQVIGRTVSMSMTAGSVLRQETLKQALVIQQGQAVLLTSTGKGFTVAAEGKALKNANEGQVVQVKVESGQVVSGIARAGGKVEVTF